MKRASLSLLFVLISVCSFGQKGYKKQYAYDSYHKDWALVKTVSGTYGFIDRSGKTVVQPAYARIEHFGKYDDNLALVKSISDSYGFIDREGKEVIPAIYDKKDIKQNFAGIRAKHLR